MKTKKIDWNIPAIEELTQNEQAVFNGGFSYWRPPPIPVPILCRILNCGGTGKKMGGPIPKKPAGGGSSSGSW